MPGSAAKSLTSTVAAPPDTEPRSTSAVRRDPGTVHAGVVPALVHVGNVLQLGNVHRMQRDRGDAGQSGILLGCFHQDSPGGRGVLLRHRADEPTRARGDPGHQRRRLAAHPGCRC